MTYDGRLRAAEATIEMLQIILDEERKRAAELRVQRIKAEADYARILSCLHYDRMHRQCILREDTAAIALSPEQMKQIFTTR